MRWKVSVGLLIFAAGIAAFIGFAARPAQAGGGFSVTIGSSHHSHWDNHWGYREHRRSRYKRHHRAHRHIYPHYWPSPWPPTPRVVIVEPPRVISPAPVPRPAPYCREFQKQIIIDGRAVQAHGVACRQPDGTWKIQP